MVTIASWEGGVVPHTYSSRSSSFNHPKRWQINLYKSSSLCHSPQRTKNSNLPRNSGWFLLLAQIFRKKIASSFESSCFSTSAASASFWAYINARWRLGTWRPQKVIQQQYHLSLVLMLEQIFGGWKLLHANNKNHQEKFPKLLTFPEM